MTPSNQPDDLISLDQLCRWTAAELSGAGDLCLHLQETISHVLIGAQVSARDQVQLQDLDRVTQILGDLARLVGEIPLALVNSELLPAPAKGCAQGETRGDRRGRSAVTDGAGDRPRDEDGDDRQSPANSWLHRSSLERVIRLHDLRDTLFSTTETGAIPHPPLSDIGQVDWL